MRSNAIIIIPIYKNVLTFNETRSLYQCFKILGQFQICFVCGKTFAFENFIPFIPTDCNYFISRFNDHYFKSIAGYNQLLISLHFYKRFRKNKYMLIYQLDAWIFKNELSYWCSLNYDYIGAPWFLGWGNATKSAEILGVGNGGFSLRNIESFSKILNSFSYVISVRKLWDKLKKHPSVSEFLKFLKNISVSNNTFFLFNNFQGNEDYFWGICVPMNFKSFKIPDAATASKFSMEVNAPLLYKANNHQLPFGCHAWEKYDNDFWKNFINVS